ncbi:zinc finger protein ZAT5 [Hordeum vulgare]|nr:zinc finger protein ZAT5 [Hordeum vulgare]
MHIQEESSNFSKSGVRSGSRSRLHTRPSTPFATSSTPVSCSRPLALATVPQEARRGTPSLPPPGPLPAPVTKTERYTSRKYMEAATTADGVRAGFYVYECKTCNKCFPTFQALGGHRASHKKPRLASAGADDDSPANATTVAITKLSKPPAMKTTSPPLAQMTTASPPLPPPPQVDAAPDVTTVPSLNNGGSAVCNAINTR